MASLQVQKGGSGQNDELVGDLSAKINQRLRAEGVEALASGQIERLKELLSKPSDDISPPPVAPPGSGFGFDREGAHEEVRVTVLNKDGGELVIALGRGSFGITRASQEELAKSFEGRLATEEEHRLFLETLLNKEVKGTISDQEKDVLSGYRNGGQVRHDTGTLVVRGYDVCVKDDFFDDFRIPQVGALVVREKRRG